MAIMIVIVVISAIALRCASGGCCNKARANRRAR